jgi:hypothetical protein
MPAEKVFLSTKLAYSVLIIPTFYQKNWVNLSKTTQFFNTVINLVNWVFFPEKWRVSPTSEEPLESGDNIGVRRYQEEVYILVLRGVARKNRGYGN